MTDTDREDLDALLDSKGWALVMDAARRRIAQDKDAGTKAAANDTNDVGALNKLRQVLAYEMGAEFVLNLPAELIGQSDRAVKAQMVSPGRRGSL